ncbi:hypothetical protein KIN20_003951 [Parelaphostrongylus tenuis]|uniref:Uncharacterized protein n=1 Tax=Parelaphostrongylus tenuis TaxID=148309 RepID=A0AAD5QGJ9_PARTN|nr:hypothetical protein KIN20_003951 [Parelaphostrongylus tenuis]
MERLDFCQCLVERDGAVINADGGFDCSTTLHVAVSRANEEIVKYLLPKGASKRAAAKLRRDMLTDENYKDKDADPHHLTILEFFICNHNINWST